MSSAASLVGTAPAHLLRANDESDDRGTSSYWSCPHPAHRRGSTWPPRRWASGLRAVPERGRSRLTNPTDPTTVSRSPPSNGRSRADVAKTWTVRATDRSDRGATTAIGSGGKCIELELDVGGIAEHQHLRAGPQCRVGGLAVFNLPVLQPLDPVVERLDVSKPEWEVVQPGYRLVERGAGAGLV